MDDWRDIPFLIFGLFIFGSAIELVRMLLSGNMADLSDPEHRAFIIVAFLFWGLMFFFFSKQGKWKLIFGVIQMVAAICLDWNQLGTLASSTSQTPVAARWTLVVGGILVFGKGFNDVIEGNKLRAKEKK